MKRILKSKLQGLVPSDMHNTCYGTSTLENTKYYSFRHIATAYRAYTV